MITGATSWNVHQTQTTVLCAPMAKIMVSPSLQFWRTWRHTSEIENIFTVYSRSIHFTACKSNNHFVYSTFSRRQYTKGTGTFSYFISANIPVGKKYNVDVMFSVNIYVSTKQFCFFEKICCGWIFQHCWTKLEMFICKPSANEVIAQRVRRNNGTSRREHKRGGGGTIRIDDAMESMAK